MLVLIVLLTLNAAAQSRFNIGLNVNETKDDTAYLNEPIIFTVTLSNQFAGWNRRNNSEAQLYLDELKSKLDKGEIKQEYYDAEVKRVKANMNVVKETTIGSVSQPWASMVEFDILNSKGEKQKLFLTPLAFPKTEAEAVLDENSYYRANYGFDNKLAAGDYTVSVRIQDETSNKVHLTILVQKIPDEVMNSEAMLLHFADYHYYKDENAKAMEYVSKLLSLYPNSSRGFTYRGDLYAQLEKWKESLADYEAALRLFNKQYPDSYEKPEYLLEMIEYVKGKQ